jgi:hypothetical protein
LSLEAGGWRLEAEAWSLKRNNRDNGLCHATSSHHQNVREQIAKLAKVNTYHVTLLAYYLEKLRSTPDGDGSLLDHLTIMYGAGMSDSNAHEFHHLPVVLLGGGAGTRKGAGHIKAVGDPWANLLVTVMDKFGVHVDQIGNSTGRLPIETISGV